MTFIAPTDETTTPTGVVDESIVEALAACDVCEHPIAEHDSISLRYCKATLSSALSRHCICRTGGA
jgi:hypothetical protein